MILTLSKMDTKQTKTIYDKITDLILLHREEKEKAVMELLTEKLEEQLDSGIIEEQISQDKIQFSIIPLKDFNEELEDFIVDEDYFSDVIGDSGFDLDENGMIWYTDRTE